MLWVWVITGQARNALIVEAVVETGVANNGRINAADIRDVNAFLKENHRELWVELHGDDETEEDGGETGFHLVQNDGANTRIFGGLNAVNTVADGLYHLGFDIENGRFLNEDGDRNAGVQTVAFWLEQFLEEDLADGSLHNDQVTPYAEPTTGTGLDALVETITGDEGLNRKVASSEIGDGARAADGMNALIVEAVVATGVANNGMINAADIRDLNAYLQDNHGELWVELHGDDETEENGGETGFHLVQNDGATSRLFGGLNAVDTVADGLYHMAFDIENGRFLNEDGNKNASVEKVAFWLGELLEEDLADGSLSNDAVDPYAVASTGTGLDALVEIITSDEGLNRKVASSEIGEGAGAADAMNDIVVQTIKATGAAEDGVLDAADVRDLNAAIQRDYGDLWIALHGDDEDGDASEETGFHLVQNDGASSRLFGGLNAVDTVADGIYHLGFDIENGRFLNEDGDRNASVEKVAFWLSELLEDDLANGTLVDPGSDLLVS